MVEFSRCFFDLLVFERTFETGGLFYTPDHTQGHERQESQRDIDIPADERVDNIYGTLTRFLLVITVPLIF